MPRSRKRSGATLLIDADVTTYQHATAAQRVYQWSDDPEDVSVAVDDINDVVAQVDEEIERLRTKLHADNVVIALSDRTGNYFRKTLLPTYKAGRRVKPVLLFEVRDYMHTRYRCFEKPGLEGDDVLGILATHPKLIPGDKVIVSIDKDMRTIPGTLYNPTKESLTVVSEQEADYFHLFQTLTGDPTDNYKGCPGIGKVKAEAILAQSSEPWPLIVAAYEAKGLTEADALVQARVARILRHTDYNFTTKEPILWQPPSSS
jgi:DNA polymerase-1